MLDILNPAAFKNAITDSKVMVILPDRGDFAALKMVFSIFLNGKKGFMSKID